MPEQTWSEMFIQAGLQVLFTQLMLLYNILYFASIGLLERVYEYLPDSFRVSLEPILTWLEVANYWFPVEESVVGMFALFEFYVLFLSVKIVAKALPFIG